MFLIFLGLPLLAFSVLLTNIRLAGYSEKTGLVRGVIHLSFSVLIPLFAGGAYFSLFYSFREYINENLNWWVFYDSIPPVQFFYLLSFLWVWLLFYSLWVEDMLPTTKYSDAVYHVTVLGFTILVFIAVLSGPIFLTIYLLIIFFEIPKTSAWTSIPYIISLIFSLMWFGLPEELTVIEEDE